MNSQDQIDKDNAEFWNNLCGSHLAKKIGIRDNSQESLNKFDEWYMRFYPYLENKYLDLADYENKKILEIGLGYGTVAQKLIDSGANYFGLDIADGPVSMVNHRISMSSADGKAIKGSILDAPFSDESFDTIVAIGSLHHTGNLAQAISEVYRLLVPNGDALIMVYNENSYRQFMKRPYETLKRIFTSEKMSVDDKIRGQYDTNIYGKSAPQTEFASKDKLLELCSMYTHIEITKENIGNDSIFRLLPRNISCALFGPYLGLDLYCKLKK